MSSNLTKRIITAIVLAAVFLTVLFATNTEIAVGFVSVVLLIGAWEWAGFAGWQSAGARLIYTALLALLMTGLFLSPDLDAMLLPVLGIACIWWFIAFLMLLFAKGKPSAFLTGLCGAVVLVPAWLAGVRILCSGENGSLLFLMLFALVAAADIGAYFTGKSIGKHKLIPRVSPGKTWEGFFGGMIAAVLVAMAGTKLFGWEPLIAAMLGLCIGMVSVVGDLTVSFFKRSAGLKDSGRILPGHGGVLDRIDGVLAALPVYAALLSALNLLDAAII